MLVLLPGSNTMYPKHIIQEIKDQLVKECHTLAVAESVTAGHLQAALSLAEGASFFFHGGITAYNLGQKARHLKVNPILADSCNCVSEKVTAQMARAAIEMFSSEWSIAITGYATPLPELGVHERFAYVSIAFRDQLLVTKKIKSERHDALECQLFYTEHALLEFERILKTRYRPMKPMLSEH